MSRKNVICLPTEHQGVHKNSFRNVRAFHNRIGIWKCRVFKEKGETGVPGGNLSEQSGEPTTKVNPHMTPCPGTEPGTHRWETSTLTTAPSLLPGEPDKSGNLFGHETQWRRAPPFSTSCTLPLGCVLASDVSFVHSASASVGFCGCLNMNRESKRAVGYLQSSY